MVLVDADSIVYACGFSTQRKFWNIGGESFDSKEAAQAFKETTGLTEEPQEVLMVEPLSNALALTKRVLTGIREHLKDSDVRVFLTGDGNFRNDVATIQPYKGNRPGIKPVHYDAIREYMVRRWGAEVVQGYEADDVIGIESVKNPSAVIVSIDKDLDQLPGTHMNWRTKEVYHISPEEGLRNLYRQVLKGDAVDNIPGLYRVTGKRCTKEVLAPLDAMNTREEMHQYTLDVYKECYALSDTKPTLDIEAAHAEVLTLLTLLTEEPCG